ncbi:MAG: SDR family NAD(P)-dependent oxidoreductase [Bdellovibrionaceae bacterium]|nr:SDR family NAD(P)-dependent oxidoreductase [Pseudobdellovibrionaceae bacterium]
MERPIAIVTGANRGLGLGTSEALAQRGFHVVMVARDNKKLSEIQLRLKEKGLQVSSANCDLHNSEQINKLIDNCLSQFNRMDVLINNAGVFLDEGDSFDTSREQLEESFLINSIAPFLLMKRVLPQMIKTNYGRIVNVTSGMGSLTNMNEGWPAYRASKAALNVFTKVMAHEVQSYNIKINSVCPGWVKTDMGGENAHRSIEEGIQGILWAATLDERGPSGGNYRDGKEISW